MSKVLAKVKDNNHEVLTIHGYVIDKEKRIAALFSSSSFFRENQEKKALIARANALLHYQSMIYFKNNGYEILERNFHSRWGEIDIIAKKEKCIVFVEVKTRKSVKYGTPAE